MVVAENGDAVVSRTYHPDGALRVDETRLRGYATMSFSDHVYALEYGYDRLGRVDSLKHPVNLTDGVAQYDRYTYDPATGALLTLTDRASLGFSFARDLAGRLTHTYGPGSMVEAVTYDLDGRRVTRAESTPLAGQLHGETFRYDGRGKLLHADNGASDFYQWYSGLGNLVATDWDNQYNGEYSLEEFRVDPLGNTFWRRSGSAGSRENYFPYATRYQPGSGRVTYVERKQASYPTNTYYPDVTSRSYDGSGNVFEGLQETSGDIPNTTYAGVTRKLRSRSYYGADDRLRVYQESERMINSATGDRGVWEEYRYDALGRRVMVRSNRSQLCQGNEAECTSHVTRFVWAGDQLLWELRARGDGSSNLEAESSSGDLYGAVSYTHAGGIDRPLVIHKRNEPRHHPARELARSVRPGHVRRRAAQRLPHEHRRPTARPSAGPATAPARGTWTRRIREINTWYGGLVDGMRDASGQMYMRNRYYDPGHGPVHAAGPHRPRRRAQQLRVRGGGPGQRMPIRMGLRRIR